MPFDYERHNEEVKQLWSAYRAGRPARVPVVFHINSRIWLLNPALNTRGYTFKDYFERPEVALETELQFQKWRRLELMEDMQKGLPAKWHIGMCGQNLMGGGWLGSEIVFRDGVVPHSAHLCGRAQHHLANLREKLNVWAFDTGFPTDLALARRQLGPAVTLWGNIHVHNLQCGTKQSLEAEVRRLLASGVMYGGRFILGDGNNVAEGTPLENLNYVCELAKRYGRYTEDQYVPDLKPAFYAYAAG
jgi:uroporphyrinogen-III decarboxylase